MSQDKVDDATAERIIELVESGEYTQEEIGEKIGVSQSTVSKVKRSHEIGKDRGREQGREEAFEEAFRFSDADNTDKEEEDEYWCSYCEQENGEKVQVEYLAPECPNDHDLSDDW